MIVTAKAPVRIDFGGAWTDVDIYARERGGVVFNATIDHYVTGQFTVQDHGEGADAREGMEVKYGFELPSGSGLGTSAALNVTWFGLLHRKPLADDHERERIAEQAYALEGILGVLGGRQDQYAAALGGFNQMHFRDAVSVDRVEVAPETMAALEARSVLCYTGRPRLSGAVHERVWGAFRAGRPDTVQALDRLREIGLTMPELLTNGDIDAFADLLAENWRCQRKLDGSVTNPQMEGLFSAARDAGARGGKACGAGGGGCLYFIAEPDRQDAVAQALADAGAQVIPFRFTHEGLCITREG